MALAIPRRRALIASFFDWGAPLHLGTHNLAEALASAGWDVGYVSAAVSPVQVARDWRDVRDRLRRWSPSGHVVRERLWTYMPLSLLTPHNVPVLRSKFVHKHWQTFTMPDLVSTVRSHGFAEVDLLYLDNPLQMFWLDEIAFASSVARITDRNTGFLGLAPELMVMESDLVKRVDLVAHVSVTVGDELRAQGVERLLYLPNGVNVSHFVQGDRCAPAEYERMPRPIALYVGGLDDWFDYELVNGAVRALPHVSFVFVGPLRPAARRLASQPNVCVLGPRPFADIPRYMHNADVGLIPFDVNGYAELVSAVSPLKLYEYLACGLPTVATRWDELERLESPAVLCDTLDEFVASIQAVILDPPNPAAGVQFAKDADWSNRLRLLLDAAGLSGPSPS